MVTVNQRDFCFFTAAKLSTQLSSQFQAASTTTHNYDFFHWRSHVTPLKFINQLLIKSYEYSL